MHADDYTLLSVVISPGISVILAESMNHDLGKVIGWCDLRVIKLNASKTKTTIVARSITMYPQSPKLTIGITVLGLCILRKYRGRTALSVVKGLLTAGVFEYEKADRPFAAVLCVLFKIRCNPINPLYVARSTWAARASVSYTRCFGRTSIHLLAASSENLAVP